MSGKKGPKNPLEDTGTFAIEGVEDETPTPAATERPPPSRAPDRGKDFLRLPSVEMEAPAEMSRGRPEARHHSGLFEEEPRKRGGGRWLLFLLILLLAGGGFYYWRTNGGVGGILPVPGESVSILVDTRAVDFQVLVDGAVLPTQDGRFSLPGGRAAKVVIRRIGYEDEEFALDPNKAGVRVIRPSFVPRKPSGFLSFETVPSATIRLFAGQQLVMEANTPVEGVSVPVGKYRVVIENPLIGYRAEEEIVIEDWKTTSVRRALPGK